MEKKITSTEKQLHRNIIFIYFECSTNISPMSPQNTMKVFSCSFQDFLSSPSGGQHLYCLLFTNTKFNIKIYCYERQKTCLIKKTQLFLVEFCVVAIRGQCSSLLQHRKTLQQPNGSSSSNQRMLCEFTGNVGGYLNHLRPPAWYPSIT